MGSRRRPDWLTGAAICLLSAWLSGCGDMPDTRSVSSDREVGLTLGPYLTPNASGGLDLRFTTTRRVAAGVRYADSSRLRRYASGNERHVIPLELKEGQPRRLQLMLGASDGPVLEVAPLPAPGRPVTLGFLAGPAQPPALARAGRMLGRAEPDAVVLVSPLPAQSPQTDSAWRESFAAPLAPLLSTAPVLLAPLAQTGMDPERFGVPDDQRVVWSRQIGCVYIIAMDSRALRHPAHASRLIAWFDHALKSRPADAPWAVLLLSEPLVGGQYVNPRALEALGSRLDRGQIQLVLSPGETPYHRSRPLAGTSGTIRHAVTGGVGAAGSLAPEQEYTAVRSDRPHVCLLQADEGRLAWTVLGLEGEPIDRFAIDLVAGDPEPIMDSGRVYEQGMAQATLRREVLSAARQAARAVANPQEPQGLPIVLRNTTSRAFAGNFVWAPAPGATWRVEPSSLAFRLEPNQQGRYVFAVHPGSGPAPELLVDAPGIGYARQTLTLLPKQTAQIPLLSGAVDVDGRFDEAFWKGATQLTGFARADGGDPKQILLCSVAATELGLAVGLRCQDSRPSRTDGNRGTRDSITDNDESVTLLLDPAGEGREFFQLTGSIYEEKLDLSGRDGLAWNPDWKIGIRFGRTNDGLEYYNAEMFVPWAALGRARPEPGETWALNVLRRDAPRRKDDADERLSWTPVPDPALSGLYGSVIFTE